MSNEHERLCVSFGELQPPALVRVECGWCGRDDVRGIVIGRHRRQRALCADFRVTNVDELVEFVPHHACMRQHRPLAIDVSAVERGEVYIIDVGDTSDTGLEQETPVSTEAREPQRVAR